MSSPYEPQQLKESANEKMLMLNTYIELEALISLFKAKGFVAECELEPFRKELREAPAYRNAYEKIQQILHAADVYEKNPNAYLHALWTAKLNGTLK